jgi:uncharacterized surface protein with fasciclin (FAS1) repeats
MKQRMHQTHGNGAFRYAAHTLQKTHFPISQQSLKPCDCNSSDYLEIPKTMKLSSFSKITAAGLMIALSIVALPSITKTAQAQIPSPTGSTDQISPEEMERQRLCDLAFQANGQTDGEGNYSFDDFQGLTLTDSQQKAYQDLQTQAEAKQAELYKQTLVVPDLSLSLIFFARGEAPPDVQAAIQAALDLKPKAGQEAALNERFSQYGVFVGPYINYLTPEQDTQLVQITSDFYRQVQSIMTPEQQPQFSQNLVGRIRINAICDERPPFVAYPNQSGILVDKLPASYTAQLSQPKTIAGLAAGDRDFSTLMTLVTMAGLAETLAGEGSFTLFAPTNEAFAALPKETLGKLLQPENRDLLRQVLTYHVVSGDRMAKDLRSEQVATVEGSRVRVRVRRRGVRVNNARVVTADIDAKNGVIHVIDRVLLPPDL